jgi:hypothetical protein
MKDFDEYLNELKEQLFCNATQEYKDNNITYLYSNEIIDNNLNYFERCMKDELSAYKALLFFNDYLNEHI